MRLLQKSCGILVNFSPFSVDPERYFLDKEKNQIVGANGQVFYCRNIQRVSYYPMEQEILITAFSKFKYIREDDDMIYLECLGY